MAYIAPVIPYLIGAGAAVSAVGTIGTAVSARNAANWNAQKAEQDAAYAKDMAGIEEQRQRIQARKQIGAMRAGYGASGLQIDGSVEDILAESASNAELDALLIRQGGAARATGLRNEANLDRAQGKNAMRSGALSAAGTLLGGAGQTSYAYNRLK